MNGYELSRKWFDYCFDNPEKIKPNHSALYFFAIEHCNRLGWKEKFGFPTEMAKDAIGIKNYKTYINTLNDLVDLGFIKMIERSKNQYSANIIALVNYTKATTKALDKASIKHNTKQVQSNCQSIDSIIKQLTKEPLTIKQVTNIKKIVLQYEKNEISFPFDSEKFKNAWELWKKYKLREHNFTYKSEISEQAALNKLIKLSGGVEKRCYELMVLAFEYGWKGFYKPTEPKGSKVAAMDDYKQEILNTINNAGEEK